MSTRDMKYNYVIYSYFKPTYELIKKQYEDNENVRVSCNGMIYGNRIVSFIHKIHWSEKINSIINLPFKKIWFKRMTNGNFNNSLPTCYVFFEGQYCIQDTDLINFIKKQNPQNKVVSHLTDIFPKENILKLKNKCDMVSTYDKGQAKLYGIEYYNSFLKINSEKKSYDEKCYDTQPLLYDLYFVGSAKDRLETIYKIYNHLSSKGVCCFFQLAGVPKENRLLGEGLEYLEKQIPYKEVLENVEKSRCVLEISQGNAVGPTMRTKEAIDKRRKLLTNRKDANEEGLFSDKQLLIFDIPENVDVSFVTSENDYEHFVNPEDCNGYPLLSFIEEELEKKFNT